MMATFFFKQWQRLFVMGMLLFYAPIAWAQSGMLERKVNINEQQMTVANALGLISEQTGCVFSYAGGVIRPEQMVRISAQSKSVRDVLYQMFGENVQWTERKNFIVLTKAKSGQRTISGYVQDKSGKPIADATVYEPMRLKSTRTNGYGYYEIKLKTDSIPPLVVGKANFNDTIILQDPKSLKLSYTVLEASDSSFAQSFRTWGDSTVAGIGGVGNWIANRIDNLTEVRNVQDSLTRTFQVSFVPGLGTNGRMSPLVTNDWSLNIIGGIHGGVKYFELGGVFNISRGDVRFFQTAGLFNYCKGSAKGFQVGGFANFVEGQVQGAQIGGFMNINQGDLNGLQVGGFLNSNQSNARGMQVAGFINTNQKGFMGCTASGFLNRSQGLSYGLQIAGFLNTANEHTGLQLAGFLNKARKVKGAQIGFINIADTVQGVAIGFLSFVKSGYKQFGLTYDELGYASLQLRTGTHFFYTILEGGVKLNPVNDITHFSFGYGVGISTNNRKPWIWNNDLVLNQYVPGSWSKTQQYVARWYTGVERSFGRHLAVVAGFTANLQAYENGGANIAFGFPERYFVINEQRNSGFSYRGWIGGRAGLRWNF